MPGECSLYFHIPFCSKKCPYCHFFVLPDDARLKRQYLEALKLEWKLRSEQLQGHSIVSLYLGGGTPTKLQPSDLKFLFQDINPNAEITLEANPEDVTESLMKKWKDLGVNRVSLGVQSLNEDELLLLGRQHSANKAVDAIEATYRSGITNISIDLMFELPNQTLSSWKKTLTRVSTLPITHLSLYNLTFEPHTVFFKQKHTLSRQLPPEEERLHMLQMAVNALEEMGLERYEISAFARDGLISRHNSGYWTGRQFLGFGPSAFSYWNGERFSNHCNLNRYLQDLQQGQFPIGFSEKLLNEASLKELFAVQLRLKEGIDCLEFEQRHQQRIPSDLKATCSKLISEGLLSQLDNRICLTNQGQLFYDTVASELI